jgi:hypothetical protein
VTPHRSIGHGGPTERMRTATVQIEAQLPVRATATESRLITGRAELESWRTDEAFPLKRGPSVHSE